MDVRVDFLQQQFTAAQAAQKAAEERLLNLLAIIHRDGGQYTAEHGIEKSFADAHEIAAGMLQAREAAEQQRDQLQAEAEKLRSQLVRGPAELGELIIGDNERLLPKGTYAYAKKDWQSWGCMLVDADGRTADRGWLYQPLPLPSSIRLPEKKEGA